MGSQDDAIVQRTGSLQQTRAIMSSNIKEEWPRWYDVAEEQNRFRSAGMMIST
jgi:hypothetical protein